MLLSHILPNAVPSPCQVLASGFGMEPGVSPGPRPPQILNSHPGALWGVPGGLWWFGDRIVDATEGSMCDARGVSPSSELNACFVCSCHPPRGGWCVCCRSTVSTGRLHPLRGFHVRPINHVFCMESPDPRGGSRNPDLGAGFPLRCFQRLSRPTIATRQCHWRDNRNTRGSSTPVLSY